MKMVKCKACKSKIKKDVDFCPYCGEPQRGKDLTHLIIILDRSGSMSSVKEATIEGFNQFISDQKKVPEPAMVSLYQFDDIYEKVYENVPLNNVDYLTDAIYQPRNTTALFDAIGKTINVHITHYNSIPKDKRPRKTLFCIITDGEENASREFKSVKQIKDLMDNVREQYKWQFAFIGAGIDAYTESAQFGIGRGQTIRSDHSHAGLTGAFVSLSSATAHYRSTTKSNDDDEEIAFSF